MSFNLVVIMTAIVIIILTYSTTSIKNLRHSRFCRCQFIKRGKAHKFQVKTKRSISLEREIGHDKRRLVMEGKVIVITGGSQRSLEGIGKALALNLASKGCKLVLAA